MHDTHKFKNRNSAEKKRDYTETATSVRRAHIHKMSNGENFLFSRHCNSCLKCFCFGQAARAIRLYWSHFDKCAVCWSIRDSFDQYFIQIRQSTNAQRERMIHKQIISNSDNAHALNTFIITRYETITLLLFSFYFLIFSAAVFFLFGQIIWWELCMSTHLSAFKLKYFIKKSKIHRIWK